MLKSKKAKLTLDELSDLPRVSRYKYLYGITIKDYADILIEQEGACAICGKIPENRLCVDHDHNSGKVRGLLCNKCNLGLGYFGDDLAIIMNAVIYLQQ